MAHRVFLVVDCEFGVKIPKFKMVVPIWSAEIKNWFKGLKKTAISFKGQHVCTRIFYSSSIGKLKMVQNKWNVQNCFVVVSDLETLIGEDCDDDYNDSMTLRTSRLCREKRPQRGCCHCRNERTRFNKRKTSLQWKKEWDEGANRARSLTS